MDSQAEALEELAFREGRNYDACLVTEPGWECFWLPDRRGVVAMVRKEKYLHVAGGLLAPPERKRELLQELLAYAAARQLVLTFFNVAEDELPLLRSFGFQATKWGEEAIVDLRDCTWAGRGYQWVRRQSSFCQRHGLVVSECRRGEMASGPWDDLISEIAAIAPLFLARSRRPANCNGSKGISTQTTWAAGGSSSPAPGMGPAGSKGFSSAILAGKGPLVPGNVPAASRRRPRHDSLPHAPGHADVPARGRPPRLVVPDPRAAVSDAHGGRQPAGPLGAGAGHARFRPGFRYGGGLSLQDPFPPPLRKPLFVRPPRRHAGLFVGLDSPAGRSPPGHRQSGPSLGRTVEEAGIQGDAANGLWTWVLGFRTWVLELRGWAGFQDPRPMT